jgi:hypothetical protein
MLDYYYYLFRNQTENIDEFCNTNAVRLYYKDCIELINEVFEDQINAINEYKKEYEYNLFDIMDYTNDDLMSVYITLAYFAMKTYIIKKIEIDNSDNNDSIITIQCAIRAKLARKEFKEQQQLKEKEEQLKEKKTNKRKTKKENNVLSK